MHILLYYLDILLVLIINLWILYVGSYQVRLSFDAPQVVFLGLVYPLDRRIKYAEWTRKELIDEVIRYRAGPHQNHLNYPLQ